MKQEKIKRIPISFAVTPDQYDEVHRKIELTKRNHKYLSGEKCLKGDAFYYLVKHGFNVYDKMVDDKVEMLKKKQQDIESMKKLEDLKCLDS